MKPLSPYKIFSYEYLGNIFIETKSSQNERKSSVLPEISRIFLKAFESAIKIFLFSKKLKIDPK